jgi:hypothetical protein
MSERKKKEVIKQINDAMTIAKVGIIKMIDSAFSCGALTEDMKLEGNYLLTKALITIYFDKRPFAPLSLKLKKEIENLARFL